MLYDSSASTGLPRLVDVACDAFIMSRPGFTDVAVYTALLQEWAADPDNPMVADTP